GFNNTDLADPFVELPMQEDRATGIWHLKTDKIALYDYYQYKIKVYHPQTHGVETLMVTDPYSLSLSTNGTHSQVVDLSAPQTQPNNWDKQQMPAIDAPEDQILYETHIRDFSASDTANTKYKGKYLAFTQLQSPPMKHLEALKRSGLNTIHLLPAFDFGSVNEDETQVIDLDDTVQTLCSKHNIASVCQGGFAPKQTIKQVLATFDPRTDAAQKVVSELRKLDNYNWGYDPVHYTVPEGSYATDPMGITRIVEFRTMVMQLHNLGFRVIMDVVYNHTHQYGLAPHSVLDKVVPGYYHRLDPISGEVEQSTCFSCGNTATERRMMAKLMEDSLKTWAQEYKIDGFRFDLMGHQPKAVMLKARDAVRKIDPDTYFYGEGWNFGEVADNRRFIQASQLALGGTEIGTFSDRLRDAVRGSGNNTRDPQGIGNGLGTMPNERQASDTIRAQYELAMNQTRIGLAGNLANFELGKLQGKTIPYGDQPTGYAYDPADTINYVSKHDNQTLWDNSQYRLPFATSTEDRVRLHNLSLSYVLYAQGIPFLHMGSELLRSKSFLRDSYDYGDWFNGVDFTKRTNNYNVGLPPADKDAENWPLIKTVLAGHQGRDMASSQDIQFASKVFENMLAVRSSAKLFRLQTAQSIMEKLHFLNQNTAHPLQGVIAMEIDDTRGEAVDGAYEKILVIFNNNPHPVDFNYAGAQDFELHHALATGADDVVKNSQMNAHGFVVPRLTAAVFVKKR
ncbi:pullulanase-type alpha-1,6-glucosidase, partial [Alteromonas sp. 14N.309.X.WAT.G.H12]|uniref:pullulanase-type alpha-1,6-glucosidase n=1 Tax=Alteromonas sp. 14N.309.X.WAT.G.H12 TaxID=3120824 RepID=UPI002FD6AE8B